MENQVPKGTPEKETEKKPKKKFNFRRALEIFALAISVVKQIKQKS